MKVRFDADNNDYVVTLQPVEAHTLIWGGFQSDVDKVNHELRTKLVSIEDAQPEEWYTRNINPLKEEQPNNA